MGRFDGHHREGSFYSDHSTAPPGGLAGTGSRIRNPIMLPEEAGVSPEDMVRTDHALRERLAGKSQLVSRLAAGS